VLEEYLKIINFAVSLILCLIFTARLKAAGDIDIDVTASGGSSVVTPTVSVDTPTAVSTPSISLTPQSPVETANATPSEKNTEELTPILTATPMTAQGILKMKDVYKAGLVYYKKQDFANAIRYLKQSLQIHDPYTPQFYYAEANAMLGVIYEFNIIDKSLAYQYYQEALRIDPSTVSAKKHIKEVKIDTDSQ
jgi:tetratricopeptide (TPR) repeat protein